MTDKNSDKPRTLADFIPPEPEPARKPSRRQTSQADRERLEALERAVRETEPEAVRRSRKTKRQSEHQEWADNKGWKTKRRRRKGGSGKFVFWAVVIMIGLAVFLD